MRSVLKYAAAAILPAMFITLAAQAGTTIWGSTHRSVAAANRIPVDTGSSSAPGYNSVSDVLDAMSGDCTSTAAAVTCTKTGGVSFGGLAVANAAPAGTLTGATLASNVLASSLTSVGTIATGVWHGTAITNTYLATPATTVNGQTCTLGSTCTVTATATGVTVGTTTITGGTTTRVQYNNAGVLGEYAISGTGSVCMTTNCALVTPALGTPSAGVLTNATGLPIGSGVSGLGTGVATFLGTPSSANFITALTDETGSGSAVFSTSPVLVTPDLGTPSALVATNATGTATTLNIGGNAATATLATTATNATNVAITNDTTTNAITYPTWVTANTGNLPAKTTSTKLTFNPSTGMLSSTGFTGTLTGNASTVTNGVYTTDTGTVTNTMLAGSVALTKLATQATNTVVGNATSGSAAPTALAVGTCSTAGSALNWTTNTGFGCNTSITAAAVPASGITGTTLASNVVTSSLTSTGTLTGGATGAGFTVALASSTITGTLPAANNETNLRHTSIGATFNGGGSAITANSKQWVYVPYGTTIQSATIACDVSGSIVFDVQMDTYANFSTAMTSIVASAPPTVTSALKSQDLTLTGWTVAIPAGDYILFKVTSATTVTNCNIVLDTIRT